MTAQADVLATCQALRLRYSAQVVLDEANLTLHAGEKVGIVGRNGSGKSSFLRILAGEDAPDEGQISYQRGLVTGYLPQDFSLDEDLDVHGNVRLGARKILDLLEAFEDPSTPADHLGQLQSEIEAHDGWSLDARIDSILTSLHAPPGTSSIRTLSGGEKRRVALARALVSRPDLLILDEPTNHLDAESVEWLETFLQSYRGACVFVTHDRYFLDRVATRIAELDGGRFFLHEGGYSAYLETKAQRREATAAAEARRQGFLRRELEWVRAGVQARRTKEQKRLDRFHEIAAQNAPAEELDPEFIIPPAPPLGNITVRLDHVGIELGGRRLFHGLNLEFPAGSCTGIIGRNGLGKSSLLRIILGQLHPTEGNAVIGERTQFNYADQDRLAVDGSRNMIEEVGAGSEFVEFGGRKLHLNGYLKRFLFSDEQLHARIDTLSGGEQNRVMMAKLLRHGGNFLVLDEPTNDLDLATLRVLEEAILAFTGVVVVVSHDRYFLDRVADRIVAFEGNRSVVVQDGNYSYYAEKRRQRLSSSATRPAPTAPSPSQATKKPRRERPRKLTWKEERELESIEPEIAGLESRIKEIEAILNSPEFYRDRAAEATPLNEERETLQHRIDERFTRWEELEAIRDAQNP